METGSDRRVLSEGVDGGARRRPVSPPARKSKGASKQVGGRRIGKAGRAWVALIEDVVRAGVNQAARLRSSEHTRKAVLAALDCQLRMRPGLVPEGYRLRCRTDADGHVYVHMVRRG